MSAQSRSEIKSLLESHGLAPIRRLGQHFLADPNITRKIVEVSEVQPGSQVLEIGAGTGTLTAALATAGAHVVAFEIDSGLQPVLQTVTGGMDVDLRFEDVTDADLARVVEAGEWSMVANLPYNVGTPLVIDSLRNLPSVERFVVMVQREVAERFAADVGSNAYGLPSVVASIYTTPRLAFVVPAQVFYPPPRVESAVVVLDRKPAPAHADRAVEIARSAFGQRRKMLRRSLAGALSVEQIEAASIDPTARAEDLSGDDYLRLAEASE